eukprot:scaffold53592_cov45-Attheya_sp.AAC.1
MAGDDTNATATSFSVATLNSPLWIIIATTLARKKRTKKLLLYYRTICRSYYGGIVACVIAYFKVHNLEANKGRDRTLIGPTVVHTTVQQTIHDTTNTKSNNNSTWNLCLSNMYLGGATVRRLLYASLSRFVSRLRTRLSRDRV